ncbi:MAG: choice-of-anchor Q domain-containing protein [Solirubrobacterales bacterium]
MRNQGRGKTAGRRRATLRRSGFGRSALVATGAAIGLLVIAPSIAQAAIRYTSPTGSGGACTEGSPCSLTQGVVGAATGDEVRLTADEYYLNSALTIGVTNLTISGPPGRYAPSDSRAFIFFRTEAEGAPAGFDNQPKFDVGQNGLTLSRLSIVGRSGPTSLINALNVDFLTLDRVIVFDDDSAFTVTAQDASIVNSVIRHTSTAVGGGTASNITGAILGSTITSATGNAVVNNDNYHDPAFGDYCELQILNTIAVGAASNLRTVDTGSTCSPNTTFDYSWIPASAGYGGGGIFPSGFITTGANNLADSPPALVTPLNGVFALALDSPAIDTGCGGSCGLEDFYGRPRPIGSGNDIGATETILPPSISTVGVDSTTSGRAELSGTINPNGGATTYNFQIRKAGTTTWEAVVGATTGQGTTTGIVRGTAQPLDPSTSYEVRLNGLNEAGVEVVSPAVTSFRTDAGPTPPPSASVQIRSAKAKLTRKSAKVQAKVRTSASGRVTLRGTTGYTPRKTWCQTTKPVTAAGIHTVTCNLGRKGRARVRKGPLGLTLRAQFTDGVNSPVLTSRVLTIPRRR